MPLGHGIGSVGAGVIQRCWFSQAGPTYTSRLWCALELFTFLAMGGTLDRITVVPVLAQSDVNQQSGCMEAMMERFREQMAQFDASDAQCFKPEERERLLGVIESGFGSLGGFNALVRNMFATRSMSNRDRVVSIDGDDDDEDEGHVDAPVDQVCVETRRKDLVVRAPADMDDDDDDGDDEGCPMVLDVAAGMQAHRAAVAPGVPANGCSVALHDLIDEWKSDPEG